MLASDPVVLQLPLWLDLTAVVVGALSGAAIAVRRDFDVAGLLVLGVAIGLGGGIIRDVLLSTTPVALTSRYYLPVAAVAALAAVVLRGAMARIGGLLGALDALSVGLFMVVGTEKALLFGLPAPGAIMVGVLAATGGGVLADVLAGDPPEIVRQGPWNAMAALVGAAVYLVLREGLDLPVGLSVVVGVATASGLRWLSVWRGWMTPVSSALVPSLRPPRRRGRRPPA